MLIDNTAKNTLLTAPGETSTLTFCTEHTEGDECAACPCLHLRPDTVFVGTPTLAVAYYKNELHDNTAFKTLLENGGTQGTWCRSTFKHPILTCKYIHYKKTEAFSEIHVPPFLPLALIPDLFPKHLIGEGGGRGAGRGRGRGRGGRGKGGRGRSAPTVNEPVPASLRKRPPTTTPSGPGVRPDTFDSKKKDKQTYRIDIHLKRRYLRPYFGVFNPSIVVDAPLVSMT
ncbi:hypothetical protein ADEAN_000079900 [Angomonas deanei]|uniref:Uncharacterized protein n=1 Tax=Angomonas deanei TaxID=59799 RepID=A0A7G2C0P3_9TRYP|nr:hypothetical protein ADEAN_000079900 [Angomonas deanei]